MVTMCFEISEPFRFFSTFCLKNERFCSSEHQWIRSLNLLLPTSVEVVGKRVRRSSETGYNAGLVVTAFFSKNKPEELSSMKLAESGV
ncbi:hypothetical protein GQ457_05G035500 [Hibiscus cannabinus]